MPLPPTSDSFNTPNPVSAAIPVPKSDLLSSHMSPTKADRDISENSDPIIEAASKTLGFYPISLNQVDDSFSIVFHFMSKILGIPDKIIQNLQPKNVWYNQPSKTVYMEFSQIQDCFIIFKHLNHPFPFYPSESQAPV